MPNFKLIESQASQRKKLLTLFHKEAKLLGIEIPPEDAEKSLGFFDLIRNEPLHERIGTLRNSDGSSVRSYVYETIEGSGRNRKLVSCGLLFEVQFQKKIFSKKIIIQEDDMKFSWKHLSKAAFIPFGAFTFILCLIGGGSEYVTDLIFGEVPYKMRHIIGLCISIIATYVFYIKQRKQVREGTVFMENPEFEKMFDALSEDKIYTRTLFTPDIIHKLVSRKHSLPPKTKITLTMKGKHLNIKYDCKKYKNFGILGHSYEPFVKMYSGFYNSTTRLTESIDFYSFGEK